MWKLVAPRPPKTHFYYIRGKYLGVRLDHSTGTSDGAAARRILKTWREQAERGEFQKPHAPAPPNFVSAAISYMHAGGPGNFLEPILKAWPNKTLESIDQIALDTLAVQLYPNLTAATRNRQVYTPVSAVLKHAGIEKKFKRPKGWKGKRSKSWLERDQAFALFDAADEVDPEFGLFCEFLLYAGGLRLEEGIERKLEDLKFESAFLYLPDSKNGDPRGCHLPPYLIKRLREQPPRQVTEVKRDASGHFLTGKPLEDAGVPFLGRSPKAKLFRFHKGGALYDMLKLAMKNAGLSFPRREGGFHIFCHTYGTWMKRYGMLDTYGLTRTGRWKDPDSADGYNHTEASEEAKRSDLLPTRQRGQVVDIKSRTA